MSSFYFPVYLCDVQTPECQTDGTPCPPDDCGCLPVRCDRTATHRQAGREVCNAHLDNHSRAPRAFALND